MDDLRLKLGIAYEGEDRDFIVIDNIIKKILPSNINYQVLRLVSPRTCILGNVTIYTRLFFCSAESVDLALFFTDQDKDKEGRKDKIRELISRVNPGYIDFSVIGVPDPHLEKWLISDYNAVKRVFGLPGDEKIPGSDLSPKDQIKFLQSLMGKEQLSFYEACENLSHELDIDVVRQRCADFNSFAGELINAIKKLSIKS